MARLEGAYEQGSQRLTSIDLRLDAVERKIDLLRTLVDSKVDALNVKVDLLRDTLDAKIDQRFMWTIGVVVTTWLTTIGTIVASTYLRH